MPRHSELLAAFDAAWDRPWESVMSTLKGIDEEEAAYQHSAFSEEMSEARASSTRDGAMVYNAST